MDESKYQSWQRQLADIGGTNPLLQFEPSSLGQLDLFRAHPSGLAQLSTAKTANLSSLVREEIALSRALAVAKKIKRKADRIEDNFGVPASFVAAGLVRYLDRGLPILLWQTHILRHGTDFELRLSNLPQINPAVAEIVRKYRPDFRESDLLAICAGQSDLLPVGVMSLLAEYLQPANSDLEKLLVLGNFVPDLVRLQLQPIDLAAGVAGYLFEQKQLSIQPSVTPITLVQNADQSQVAVIEKANSGKSFAVQTLPGCGYLQTVVNLLANLALDGKRALVVAPRKQTLDELAERLSQAGLAGLAVRESDSWSDAVAAISRNEKAVPGDLISARARYQTSNKEVADYFTAIGEPDPELAITLMQCITELAELAASTHPPTNSARIRLELLPQIKNVIEPLLAQAHEAGLFSYQPTSNPWFGARFSSQVEIDKALSAVKQLAGENWRMLSYQISRYLTDLDLAKSDSVEQWSEQLRLLLGIRYTLDRFLPTIFDHPLADLIAATAPRGVASELSGAQRRRYKKLAKEFIRPGSSVPNLHQALVAAKEQREGWEKFNTTSAPPSVPLGLADVQSKFESIVEVLNLLQGHLDPNPDLPLLVRLPLEELGMKLELLAINTELLNRLEERRPITEKLQSLGLGQFIREVSESSPSLDQVKREFELSWWQSALEAIVSRSPELLEYSADRLAMIELGFEQAGNHLIEQGVISTQHALAERWRSGIAKHPANADKLRAQLRQRSLNLKEGYSSGGELWKALSPAVAISPYRISQLAKGEQFDVLLILDAASTGAAEILPALSLAEQAIAFGDPVISAPENFDTVARVSSEKEPAERDSAYQLVADQFEVVSINRNWRTSGQVLGKYLNQTFYNNQLVLEPTPAMLFGEHNFEHFEVTENARAIASADGSTESLASEVEQVVALVLSHARWTPDESLLVVSASKLHAERVEERVAQEVAKQPELAEFFDAHGRERFECLSMSELTHRLADRVIFTVGFGRTAEGRISGTLGDFNSASAGRWMVNQVVSARKRMTAVSCYNFEDFAGMSLPENQRWLKDLVAPSFLQETPDGKPDPLLQDLAKRLEKLGIKVVLNFASRIGLAASYGSKAVVVDADWSLVGDSLDEQLRLRPGLLRAMGWEYQRVHAFEIFAKPQDVANRIAQTLGINLQGKPEKLFDELATEDRPERWGDGDDSNDDRLRDDKPPHWG
ncbi:MAG: hypothetical protein F2536_04165 [Actinobacteria bacterium]|uniref:Unannotated protein n=1 Tax=freshwater metagenome TaxID=449393 RepID=A0A6J6DLR5_9ZZZZ|nr:hypothetical protein [Actinomycetota bacterium]MTA90094.1 hypothetical protein [Actinomycetota bacterium]